MNRLQLVSTVPEWLYAIYIQALRDSTGLSATIICRACLTVPVQSSLDAMPNAWHRSKQLHQVKAGVVYDRLHNRQHHARHTKQQRQQCFLLDLRLPDHNANHDKVHLWQYLLRRLWCT